MKSLFAKSVVFFLVLMISRCAPGTLGTIDRYTPEFSLNENDDEEHTIVSIESDNTTEDWFFDEYDYSDVTTIKLPMESLVAHIDQLAEQDGITKGQYVYTDKTGRSITISYVAGPSSLFDNN